MCLIFFVKQKTAYEMRISDWSSDVCSSDLQPASRARHLRDSPRPDRRSPGRPAVAERQPGRSHHRTCRRARPRPQADGTGRYKHRIAPWGSHSRGPDSARNSVGSGKMVSDSVDLGGSLCIKKKTATEKT